MAENENEQIVDSEQDQSVSFKDFLTKLYKLEPDVRRKLEENELRLNDNQIFLLIMAEKSFLEFFKLIEQLDFETMQGRIQIKRAEIQTDLNNKMIKLNSPIITVQKPAGMPEAQFRKGIDIEIMMKKQEISQQMLEANKGFDQDLINIETFKAIFDLTREIFNKYNQKKEG